MELNGDKVIMLLGAAWTDKASLAIKQAIHRRIRYSIWESAKSRGQNNIIAKTRITAISHMFCFK